MEYMLEISDMKGDGIASQEFSQFETTTPIPIPSVGDRIYLPGGCGPEGKNAKEVIVSERQFTYTPEGENDDAFVHVQLFCKNMSSS